MKELEKQAREDLIEVYTLFLESENDRILTEQAKTVYNNYIPASALLSDNIMSFIMKLFPMAYPNSNSEIDLMTKGEAKEILNDLKKIKY